MKKVLVIGGELSFVEGRLANQLRAHGLVIEKVWPWDKQAGSFPENIEVVFVMTDMASHRLNDAAQAQAKSRNIPIIYGGRKYAHNVERLNAAGFPVLAPEVTVTNTILKKPTFAPSVLSNPATLPVLPSVPKNEVDHHPRVKNLGQKGLRSLYDLFLIALAEDPSLSNRAISNQFNTAYGSTGEPARCARLTLGLSMSSDTGNSIVNIDRSRYEKVCKALGVTPVPGTTYTKTAGHNPDKPSAPVIEKPAVVPPPAPVAAPVTAPAIRADDEAEQFAKKPTINDLRDLVILLRAEMAKRNITKLILTPDDVEAIKVVTVSETLGF